MPIDKSTIKKGVFIIGGDCPVPLITKDHPPPVRYGAPTLAATAQALYAMSGGLATAVLDSPVARSLRTTGRTAFLVMALICALALPPALRFRPGA